MCVCIDSQENGTTRHDGGMIDDSWGLFCFAAQLIHSCYCYRKNLPFPIPVDDDDCPLKIKKRETEI